MANENEQKFIRDRGNNALVAPNDDKYNQARKRKAAVSRQQINENKVKVLEAKVARLEKLVEGLLTAKPARKPAAKKSPQQDNG